ncbi:MAG: type II toxin-antitoxin system RelE/ParE family toxin [Prosthecobacter sp.]|uniref:type II toxin-antitoxin system RelE/ParE family toxin n=1 Tax=Prosthecobacter sp. TaxID=1965333 RepID=UPI00390438E4
MSHGLEVSPEALESMDDQMRWYETNVRPGGDELAELWRARLHESLETLSRHPEWHGLAAESGKWHPEIVLRRMLFRPWKSGKGWRVLFWIDEAAGRVVVLEVRHESRPPLAEEVS